MADVKNLSVEELLGRMMGLELYVVRNELQGKAQDLVPHLKEHLIFMIELEKSGQLFASGPTYDAEGNMTGEGLTILRANNIKEAEAIAKQDPFVKAGIRKGHVQKWRVNEGRMSLTVDFSDRSAMLV
ncbi:MAG: YciI family protein [Pseudomonadota bacterium]